MATLAPGKVEESNNAKTPSAAESAAQASKGAESNKVKDVAVTEKVDGILVTLASEIEPPPAAPAVPPPEVEPEVPQASRALKFLVVLAVIYTLYFARAVLLPLALAIVLSLLLRPIVRGLARRRVPEAVGATLCLLALAGVLVVIGAQLAGPIQQWVADMPKLTQEAGVKLEGIKSRLRQFTQAREKIEEIAGGDARPLAVKADANGAVVPVSTNGDAEPRQPTQVVLQQTSLSSNFLLMSATGEFLAGLGLVVVLAFFLLTEGDRLINNILTTMPTFRDKRHFVELIQNIQKGVSSYLSTVTVINIGLGMATALEVWLIGLPNPLLWGVLATLLNFIPFLGALVTGAMLAFASLLAFDSLAYAAVAPICFYVTAALEGNIITPALLGKRMSLSPILVIVYLTFWGWMWGVGGALLAVPLLAATKIFCDQFENTQPLGTMLG